MTPSISDKHDIQYKDLVTFDCLLVEDFYYIHSPSNTDVIPVDVMKIIKSFKNNKAKYCRGLAEEHLKFSLVSLSCYLADTSILNFILRTG